MKNKYIISIAIFFIVLAGMGLFSFLDPDDVFSDSENRELSSMPSFELSSYLDGSFMTDFETYFNDQFPFRNQFLSFSKSYNALMFPNYLISEDDVITLPSSGVIAGSTEDTGDSEDGQEVSETEIPDVNNGKMLYGGRIMEIFKVSESFVTKYTTIVNQLTAECGYPDTYVLLAAPEYTLYAPDSYKSDDTNFDTSFDLMVSQLENITVVDVRKTFTDKKDEYLYFRSDHHWTALGAYYACNEFLKASGNPILPPLATYESGERTGFLGSLYKDIMTTQLGSIFENNPDTVKYYFPFAEAEVTSYTTTALTDPTIRQVIYPDYDRNTNLYAIYMGGDIPLGHITTGTKNGKSIMVVRDSYGHAFIPFLIDAYEEIWLVEPRYFNDTTNKFELGEFFIAHDIDTLLFLGYPNMTIGAY